MSILDPKPVTQAGLDTKVKDAIENTSSATRGALNVTYAPASGSASYAKRGNYRIQDPIGAIPAVATGGPTVTLTNNTGLSSTITTGRKANAAGWYASIAPTNTASFRFLGTGGLFNNNSADAFPDNFSVAFPTVGNAGRIESVFDGAQIEYLIKQVVGAQYWIKVDGQYLTTLPVTVAGTAGDSANVKLVFADRAVRRIEFEITNTRFYGAFIQVNDSLRATATTTKRIVVMGDSYTGGAMAVSNLTTFASKLAYLLGYKDYTVSGIGGTGYLAPGTSVKFRDRVQTDVVNLNADLVIVAGGHNDTSFTNAAIQAEADLLFKAIKAGASKPRLIVTGPLTQGAAVSSYTAMQAAIFAAATSGGADATIDTTTNPIFTGTGSAGSRAVTDGATTAASTTITSNTAAFVAGDIGVVITGGTIPANTTIASVTNATTVVLSAAPTATASAVSLTITKQKLDGNSDLYIETDGVHPTQSGHDYLANILAEAISAKL